LWDGVLGLARRTGLAGCFRQTIEKGGAALLSIVVLTRNRCRLLADCLDSLARQTVAPLEVIVVDDGSTDETRAWMETKVRGCAALRYLRQPHRGIAAARNTGIRSARGSLIAIVADDYVMAPDYVETVIRFFDDDSGAQVVRFKIGSHDERFLSRASHLYFELSTARRSQAAARAQGVTTRHDLDASGAAAFRPQVFDRVGLYDETFLRAEDTEWTRRLRLEGIPVHYVPGHVVRHQYGSMLATARQCFETGYHRWSFHRRYSSRLLTLIGHNSRDKLAVLLGALAAARRGGALTEFLAALPVVALLELANRLGVACGALSTIVRRAPATSRTSHFALY